MELLNPIIFIQGFLWASLLYKSKKIAALIMLELAFLAMLNHFRLNAIISSGEITTAVMLLLAFAATGHGFFYYRKKAESRESSPPIFLILPAALAALGYGFFPLAYPYIVIAASLTCLLIILSYSIFRLIPYLKSKPYPGQFFDSPRMIFLVAAPALASLLFASVFYQQVFLAAEDTFRSLLVYVPLAVLMFYSGYYEVVLESASPQSRQAKPMPSLPAGPLSDRIMELMDDEKIYLNPDLSLETLALAAGAHPSELSAVLNRQIGKNFNELVNAYRVEAVKEKLKTPDARLFTYTAIAYECGFNSKSTFYRIFKDHTGLTPKEYSSKEKMYV